MAETSTKATFTPGPWAVAPYTKKKFGLGRRGRNGGGAFFLLECVNDDTDSQAARADAVLIAAAPEMYEALKRISSAVDGGIYRPTQAEFDAVEAAIARAEGR